MGKLKKLLCGIFVSLLVSLGITLPVYAAQITGFGPTGRVIPSGSSVELTAEFTNSVRNCQIYLDQQPLITQFRTDYDSYFTGYATMPENSSRGKHHIKAEATDFAGVYTSKEWDFYYDSVPVIEVTPAKNSAVDTLKPVISITVKDDTPIGKDNVFLALDDKNVDFSLQSRDSTTLAITYEVAANLSNEATHTLKLQVNDLAGATAFSWFYYVNTYGEISQTFSPQYSNLQLNFPWDSTSLGATCWRCHSGKGALSQYIIDNTFTETTLQEYIVSASSGDPNIVAKSLAFNEVHKIYKTGTDGKYRQDTTTCASCHTSSHVITTKTDCAPTCHNGGSSPTQSGKNYFNYHSLNKHAVAAGKCDICHGTPTQAAVPYPRPSKTSLNASSKLGHNFAAVHKPQQDFVSCSRCHSQYLWREKGRFGHQCAICHNSTDPKVSAAMAKGSTNCSACHANSDHEATHTGNIETKCAQCHNKVISTEHQARGLDCYTCHKSSNKYVQRAITANNLNCPACHNQAHGILIVDSLPAGVPVWDKFQWSAPVEAILAYVDQDIPPGYEDGQLVMSNRNRNVTAGQIWDFYSNSLSQAGWALSSAPYAEGSTNLSAEFSKDTRKLTLKAYNTLSNSGTGVPLESGYRVELWYK